MTTTVARLLLVLAVGCHASRPPSSSTPTPTPTQRQPPTTTESQPRVIDNRAGASGLSQEVWIQRTHQESAASANPRYRVTTRMLTIVTDKATLQVDVVGRDRGKPNDPWKAESSTVLQGTATATANGYTIELHGAAPDQHESWTCQRKRQGVAAEDALRVSAGQENMSGKWEPAATEQVDTLACADQIDFGTPAGIENACATNVGCGLRRIPDDGSIKRLTR